MYLNKLLLKNFGKFNNREIILKPGINVISGQKDSGKTTIKEFIVAMLYGFSNCALNEKRVKKFEVYKPKDGSVFSGKANLKEDDKTYFIEKSFAKKNSRTSVLELNSGKEIKIDNDSLDGCIFDCCRDDYVNAFCIDNNEENIEEYVKHDFNNMIISGAATVETNKSIAYLKKKRREYDTSLVEENLEMIDSELEDYEDVDSKLKKVRKKIRDVEEELAIETARRKREARRLIQSKTLKEESEDAEDQEEKKPDDKMSETVSENGTEDKKESGATFLDADLLKDYKPEVKLTDKIWFIILTGLFVIGVIAAIVCILPFDKAVRQIFIICTILFVIVTIVEGLYAKGVFDEEIMTPSDEEFKRIIYELERKTETYEEVEIDMSFAQSYIDRREALADEERAILKDMSRRDELKEERKVYDRKLKEANQEIHAINLAINTINDISKDISKSYSFMINNNISDIISKLSSNKFNDLYVNENNKLMVMGQNGYIDVDSLDKVELGEVYLALKLAVSKSMIEKNMPIIFDGIFDILEDTLLTKALDIVKSLRADQIIILTSDARVEGYLNNKNKSYNLITV